VTVKREGHAAYAERKKERKRNPKLSHNQNQNQKQNNTTQPNPLDPLFDLAYPFDFFDSSPQSEREREDLFE